MSENKTMSEREMRLAAEMGKPVEASIQNKIMEEVKERTKKRVQEMRREKAEAEAKKAQEEKIANIPPMSKRQKLEYEKQQANNNGEDIYKDMTNQQEEIENVVYGKDISSEKPFIDETKFRTMPNIIVEDLKTIDKVNDIVRFKPSAINNTFKKIKIEELPSRYISYPEGAEVFITPYSGDEIDELSNSRLTLKYILTKCMEGVYTNFDKNKITFYDALYLSFNRRVLSINDSKIQIASQCPYCNKFSTTTVNIDKQIEFEDIKIPTLPINIDFSFGRLQFSFLTYGDFMKLQTDLKSEELAYQCITECEVDTEAGEDPKEELRKLFGNLVGEDQALLNKVRELTYHGIKPINTLCQNKDCGKTYETILDEMSSIILPFHPSNKDIRTKVSFG